LFGEKAEKVFEAMVEHGRVTWTQLRTACSQFSDDSLKETADALLREKYIVRVLSTPNRTSMPSISLPAQLGSTSKVGNTSAVSKKRKAADETDSSGQRGGMSKLRRGEGDLSKGGETDSASLDDSTGVDVVACESVTTPGSVWCVNSAAFEWDFRSLAMAQLMADRYGPATSSLMKLLLKTVRNRALQPNSNYLNRGYAASVDSILAQHKLAVQEGQEIHSPNSWEGISEALNTLSQDSFHAIQKVHDAGPDGLLYRPQIAELISHLRRQIVEQHVEKRFHSKGRRLFRLLMDRSKSIHGSICLPPSMLRFLSIGLASFGRIPFDPPPS
jgi:hypothetical protein